VRRLISSSLFHHPRPAEHRKTSFSIPWADAMVLWVSKILDSADAISVSPDSLAIGLPRCARLDPHHASPPQLRKTLSMLASGVWASFLATLSLGATTVATAIIATSRSGSLSR